MHYRLALAGACGSAAYAGWQVTRQQTGTRRAAWIAMAVLEAAIAVGVWQARQRGVHAATEPA